MNVKSDCKLPDFLRPFLWSYDFSKLEKVKHKRIIIKNILDFGTKKTTDWLKENYTEAEIKNVIKQTSVSEWSKKSINFWSFIYGVLPNKSRFNT